MKKKRKRIDVNENLPKIKKRKKLSLESEIKKRKRKKLVLEKPKKKKKKRKKLVYDPKADLYRTVYIECTVRNRGKEYSKRVNALVCYSKQQGICRVPEASHYLDHCKKCPCDWEEQANKKLFPERYRKKRTKIKLGKESKHGRKKTKSK